MNYELKTEKFSGPLEKLLELIEGKKLEVTELSLAEVTGGFLNYLKTVEAAAPRLLADFVVVASRLLLIKSKSLIPSFELTEEEKEDVSDLQDRLRIYQELRFAKNCVGELYDGQSRLLSREFFMKTSPIFYPLAGITVGDLGNSVEKILAALGEIKKAESFKVEIVSVEKKVSEILNRLQNLSNFSFQGHAVEKPKAEIVALFLAILHLLKEGAVKAQQNEHFSDIIVSK